MGGRVGVRAGAALGEAATKVDSARTALDSENRRSRLGSGMDETEIGEVTTVGEQLRAAREAQGLTIEDIAARTRIPTRHLQSIEDSDWSKMPAPTYSIGFAKSYAVIVGLDRVEIAEQLRGEMGGFRSATTASEVFEPADPARVPPRWLVFGAIAAVILVVALLLFLQQRSLSGPDAPAAAPEAAAQVASGNPASTTTGAAGGPVVITANEPVWIQVYERGGSDLFQGELAAGQSFEVPAAATAPLLRTGKPQAIRIAVGTADAPAVGPAAVTVSDVSLLAADLLRGPPAEPPAVALAQ